MVEMFTGTIVLIAFLAFLYAVSRPSGEDSMAPRQPEPLWKWEEKTTKEEPK